MGTLTLVPILILKHLFPAPCKIGNLVARRDCVLSHFDAIFSLSLIEIITIFTPLISPAFGTTNKKAAYLAAFLFVSQFPIAPCPSANHENPSLPFFDKGGLVEFETKKKQNLIGSGAAGSASNQKAGNRGRFLSVCF